jgi:hypothetical protein
VLRLDKALAAAWCCRHWRFRRDCGYDGRRLRDGCGRLVRALHGWGWTLDSFAALGRCLAGHPIVALAPIEALAALTTTLEPLGAVLLAFTAARPVGAIEPFLPVVAFAALVWPAVAPVLVVALIAPHALTELPIAVAVAILALALALTLALTMAVILAVIVVAITIVPAAVIPAALVARALIDASLLAALMAALLLIVAALLLLAGCRLRLTGAFRAAHLVLAGLTGGVERLARLATELARPRQIALAAIPALLLHLLLAVGKDDAVVVFCVLQIVFRQHRVARRQRIARQRHIFLGDLRRRAVNFLVRPVRLIGPHQRIVVMLALAVLMTTAATAAAIIAPAAAPPVLLSLPHGTLVFRVNGLKSLVCFEDAGVLAPNAQPGWPKWSVRTGAM